MIVTIYLVGALIVSLLMTYLSGRELYDNFDIVGSAILVILWPFVLLLIVAFAIMLLLAFPFIFLYKLGKKHSS